MVQDFVILCDERQYNTTIMRKNSLFMPQAGYSRAEMESKLELCEKNKTQANHLQTS
jgi:hypothetical protein